CALRLPAGRRRQPGCPAALRRTGLPHGLRVRIPHPLFALTLQHVPPIVPPGRNNKMAHYPWEKSYPPGVTWQLEVPRKTIHQIFEESCAQFGDRPFTDFLDKVMTFRDYKEASDKAAAGFQR